MGSGRENIKRRTLSRGKSVALSWQTRVLHFLSLGFAPEFAPLYLGWDLGVLGAWVEARANLLGSLLLLSLS